METRFGARCRGTRFHRVAPGTSRPPWPGGGTPPGPPSRPLASGRKTPPVPPPAIPDNRSPLMGTGLREGVGRVELRQGARGAGASRAFPCDPLAPGTSRPRGGRPLDGGATRGREGAPHRVPPRPPWPGDGTPRVPPSPLCLWTAPPRSPLAPLPPPPRTPALPDSRNPFMGTGLREGVGRVELRPGWRGAGASRAFQCQPLAPGTSRPRGGRPLDGGGTRGREGEPPGPPLAPLGLGTEAPRPPYPAILTDCWEWASGGAAVGDEGGRPVAPRTSRPHAERPCGGGGRALPREGHGVVELGLRASVGVGGATRGR